MQERAAIRLDRLSAGYGRERVLKEISLQIPEGKITAVLGPNGSGKSTLLKSIAGLCRRMDGEIFLKDKRRADYSEKEFAGKVFYLAQSHPDSAIRTERLVLHGRFPHLSYPRRYSREDYQYCENAMRQTGIENLREKRLSELSGGQKQKAYLAMALAGQAEVLLFDEPTTYLDIQYQTELFELLRELKRSGRTIAAVLHDIDYALRLSDWVLLLQEGRLVVQGTPEEVWQSGKIAEVFRVKTGCAADSEGGVHYYFRQEEYNK